MKELKEGNGRKKWINRENYAYWKGNAFISMPRYKLLKCSRSTQHDWKARVYMQVYILSNLTPYNNSIPITINNGVKYSKILNSI